MQNKKLANKIINKVINMFCGTLLVFHCEKLIFCVLFISFVCIFSALFLLCLTIKLNEKSVLQEVNVTSLPGGRAVSRQLKLNIKERWRSVPWIPLKPNHGRTLVCH